MTGARSLRLLVTTPTELIADLPGVRHVRAEDASGAFGIQPGHADLITVLPASVVTWRDTDGRERFLLVRRAVLQVRDGERVEIAARGAVLEEALERLDDRAIAALEHEEAGEDLSRREETRLHLATMRQIERVLSARRALDMPLPPLHRREPADTADA